MQPYYVIDGIPGMDISMSGIKLFDYVERLKGYQEIKWSVKIVNIDK